MKTFYKRMSIRQKLLFMFSIQILIPLIFMGMLLYQSALTIIRNKSIDYSGDIMKMIELRMDDFTENVKVASQDVLYDPIIYEVLTRPESQLSEITEEQLDDMNNILRKICLSRDEIKSIALISNDKRYYTYDSNTGRAHIKTLIPYKAIHDTALKGKGEVEWFLDYDKNGEVTDIYATRIVYNISNYEEIGVMAMLIKKDELNAVYGNLSTEFMESIAFVSESGDWITGTSKGKSSLRKDVTQRVTERNRDHWIDDEAGMLVSYANVIDPHWSIVTEISLERLNEDLYRFRRFFIVITIATLFILSLLSLFLAVDIIDPINRLVDAMRHMKQDKTHDVIEVDRKDELGYLSHCFNDMSEEIDFLLNQVYKEQLTRKEAELKTLQAQINPHFLFNTLESINWMARLNDIPQISEMVTALSTLMEAGIGKGAPQVRLSEEIQFVDSYILIMKNRYGDRLEVETYVDDSLLERRVPKLILQPIVENAIYHGIDKQRRKGKIVLNIHEENGKVIIMVEDNGRGIANNELDVLNQQLRENDDAYLVQDSGTAPISIGLRNVNRRLKLFYGKDYGVIIYSEYDVFTRVVLTLPLEEEGD